MTFCLRFSIILCNLLLLGVIVLFMSQSGEAFQTRAGVPVPHKMQGSKKKSPGAAGIEAGTGPSSVPAQKLRTKYS
jgi:hypothetical protein